MTARVTIVCDECGQGRHTMYSTIAEARQDAAHVGWTTSNDRGVRRDLCPAHSRPALRLVTS